VGVHADCRRVVKFADKDGRRFFAHPRQFGQFRNRFGNTAAEIFHNHGRRFFQMFGFRVIKPTRFDYVFNFGYVGGNNIANHWKLCK
jgi:hypothetical protein